MGSAVPMTMEFPAFSINPNRFPSTGLPLTGRRDPTSPSHHQAIKIKAAKLLLLPKKSGPLINSYPPKYSQETKKEKKKKKRKTEGRNPRQEDLPQIIEWLGSKIQVCADMYAPTRAVLP